MKTVSVICAKFQVILWEFANFQKLREKKKWGKMIQLQVNSRNPSAVHHNLLKLCFITTGSDSVMYAKFQINLMRYGEFPNKQNMKEIAPESYRGEMLDSLQNH